MARWIPMLEPSNGCVLGLLPGIPRATSHCKLELSLPSEFRMVRNACQLDS